MQRIVRHTIAIVLHVEGELATADLDGVHLLEQDAKLTALVHQALAAWGGAVMPNQPHELRVQVVPQAHGFQVQIALWWISRQNMESDVSHTSFLP